MAQLPLPAPHLFGHGTSEELGACFAENTQALQMLGDLCVRHSSNKEVLGQRESSPACPIPALGLAGGWVCGFCMSFAGPWVSHQWEGICPNKGKEEG